jgi:hypothetical protein
MHAKDCQHAAVADDDYMDEDELLAEMMSMFNFIFMRSGSGFGGRAGVSLGGPFGGGGGGTPSRS